MFATHALTKKSRSTHVLTPVAVWVSKSRADWRPFGAGVAARRGSRGAWPRGSQGDGQHDRHIRLLLKGLQHVAGWQCPGRPGLSAQSGGALD